MPTRNCHCKRCRSAELNGAPAWSAAGPAFRYTNVAWRQRLPGTIPFGGRAVSLSVEQVTRAAKAAARAASPALDVVGITLGGGASGGYVEILVTVRGCRMAPCQIHVGAFRDVSDSALESEIEGKLREHLAAHPPAT